MSKKLKIWNGRSHGKYNKGHIYVAAYSQKQAAELISKSCNTFITANEIREYYSPCWGNSMNGIEPTEPCVYIQERVFQKEPPIRIL